MPDPRTSAGDASLPRVSGDVSLADWLLALSLVRSASERRAELAALLGFALAAPRPKGAADGDERDAPRREDASRDAAEPADAPVRPRRDDDRDDAPDAADEALPVTVRRLPPDEPEDDPGVPPPWLDAFPMPKGRESAHLSRPRLDPLLVPRWTRGVLAEMLGGTTTSGALDVRRLVDDVAARRLVRALPRLRRRTLAHGVQLLLDRGPAMTPFFRDQEDLLAHARATVGREKVDVVRFAASPTRGAGRGPVTDWSRYEPPPPRTPVVVVTDLGIGRPRSSRDRASSREWTAFTRIVREADCPLLAFVPYARRRWPRELERVMTIVPWDRATSADLVRRHLAPGGPA